MTVRTPPPPRRHVSTSDVRMVRTVLMGHPAEIACEPTQCHALASVEQDGDTHSHSQHFATYTSLMRPALRCV